MVALKKYNLKGEEVGDVEIDDQFLDVNVNHQLIKDYLVALRANARQWSASTKTRSEVSHTTKKPFKQKGTGNARQGSLVSPQFRGGGIVFGPRPKFDQRIRINKKERRMAIRHLFAEKIKGQNVIVVEDSVFGGALQEPKTKDVVAFLKNRAVVGKRLLFVGESHVEEGTNDEKPVKHRNFKLSVRNLPRTHFDEALNLNGYSIVVAHKIIITESALAEIRQMFV